MKNSIVLYHDKYNMRIGIIDMRLQYAYCIKQDSRTELQFMEQISKTIFIKNEPKSSKVPEVRGQMR